MWRRKMKKKLEDRGNGTITSDAPGMKEEEGSRGRRRNKVIEEGRMDHFRKKMWRKGIEIIDTIRMNKGPFSIRRFQP